MPTDTRPIDWRGIAVRLVRTNPHVHFQGLPQRECDALRDALDEAAEIARDVRDERAADAADYHAYRDETTP